MFKKTLDEEAKTYIKDLFTEIDQINKGAIPCQYVRKKKKKKKRKRRRKRKRIAISPKTKMRRKKKGIRTEEVKPFCFVSYK